IRTSTTCTPTSPRRRRLQRARIPRRSRWPYSTPRRPKRRDSSRSGASARRSAATIPAPADRARNTSSATAGWRESGGTEAQMPVNLEAPARDALLPVAGVAIGTAQAGIRKANRRDVLVLRLPDGAAAAGVFTTNRFCAAPVRVCREHLAGSGGSVRALVVNTGCANAGTGEQGIANARRSCEEVARLVGCTAEQVLPFSTGVILEHLPMERLLPGIGAAVSALGSSEWLDAAAAIMTPDTLPKGASRALDVGGRRVVVTGIAKGSGMIRPNMATMLGYIVTDAALPPALLARWVR